MGCTLCPSGLICVAVAMQPVATVTVAMRYCMFVCVAARRTQHSLPQVSSYSWWILIVSVSEGLQEPGCTRWALVKNIYFTSFHGLFHDCVLVYLLFAIYEVRRHSIDNTVEENSVIFSLIWMHWLSSAWAAGSKTLHQHTGWCRITRAIQPYNRFFRKFA